MTIRSDVLAIFQELDSNERYRRQRTDCKSVRGGRRSIKLLVSSSLRAPRRMDATLTSLAALLKVAANAALDNKARVLLTCPEPLSAGLELTISRTSKPLFSRAVAN